MFSLKNTYTKLNTTIEITFRDNTLAFTITNMIGMRGKSDLDETSFFLLLNSYLDYKGDEFKAVLFEELRKSYDIINNVLLFRKGIVPHPVELVNGILNLFDMSDVFNFLKNIYKLQPPSNLQEEFNTMIEKDARGSRVQTFLKDDYLELSSLVLIIKASIAPVYMFGYIKKEEIEKVNKDYILSHLYKKHPIFESAPMQKLLGWIDKLIEQTKQGKETDDIRSIEKMLPKYEIPYYILGIILIQRVATATLIKDNASENIITNIYNYVNSKLKNSADVSKSIRNKTVLSDVDDGGEDNESLIESYRSQDKISSATIVEFNWSVSNIDRIITMMPDAQRACINKEVLEDAKVFCKALLNTNLDSTHIFILSIIFKMIINPKSLDYIKIENIYNLIVVGFAYLWGLECRNMALLLVSNVDESSSNEFFINSTTNKSRIPKEIKDELDTLFPYKRVINDETSVNVVEETINTVSSNIYSKRWIPVAYEKYIEGALGNLDIQKLITSELKIMISEFIIKNERKINV